MRQSGMLQAIVVPAVCRHGLGDLHRLKVDRPVPRQQTASNDETARHHATGLLALLSFNPLEETLAVKTGDVRGADEGVSALSRSFAGQQNRFADAIPVSMSGTVPRPSAAG